MEKKNKILIMVIFIITAGVIGFLIFLDFEKKPEIHSNIEELYSSFTDYMKAHVNFPLGRLGCQPQLYSDNGSTICFMCEGVDACFGYGWVNRGSEGMKMNPRGFPYLNNIETNGKLKVEFVDFCHQGLASQFNCQEKENYNDLECREIKFSARFGKVLKCENVDIVLMEGVDFQNFAEYFCNLKGEELQSIEFYPEESSSLAFCQNYIIFSHANKIKIIEKSFNEG